MIVITLYNSHELVIAFEYVTDESDIPEALRKMGPFMVGDYITIRKRP